MTWQPGPDNAAHVLAAAGSGSGRRWWRGTAKRCRPPAVVWVALSVFFWMPTATTPPKALLVWGGVDAGGDPYLEPAFVIDAPPALPRSDGEYRLAGRAHDGRELFSLSFDMPEIADGDGRSSFTFVLAAQASWEADLASIACGSRRGQ